MVTYSDQIAIMKNQAFLDRITVAVAKYAEFIMGESPATTDHARRYAWAKQALQSPSSYASQIIAACTWDPAVTALANGTIDASSLTDAQVQSITESAVNTYALTWF